MYTDLYTYTYTLYCILGLGYTRATASLPLSIYPNGTRSGPLPLDFYTFTERAF